MAMVSGVMVYLIFDLGNGMFPSLPMFDTSAWIPLSLVGRRYHGPSRSRRPEVRVLLARPVHAIETDHLVFRRHQVSSQWGV